MDPYNLHDLIEKVSDKLGEESPMEAVVIIAHAFDLNCDDVAQAVLHGTS